MLNTLVTALLIYATASQRNAGGSYGATLFFSGEGGNNNLLAVALGSGSTSEPQLIAATDNYGTPPTALLLNATFAPAFYSFIHHTPTTLIFDNWSVDALVVDFSAEHNQVIFLTLYVAQEYNGIDTIFTQAAQLRQTRENGQFTYTGKSPVDLKIPAGAHWFLMASVGTVTPIGTGYTSIVTPLTVSVSYRLLTD